MKNSRIFRKASNYLVYFTDNKVNDPVCMEYSYSDIEYFLITIQLGPLFTIALHLKIQNKDIR